MINKVSKIHRNEFLYIQNLMYFITLVEFIFSPHAIAKIKKGNNLIQYNIKFEINFNIHIQKLKYKNPFNSKFDQRLHKILDKTFVIILFFTLNRNMNKKC